MVKPDPLNIVDDREDTTRKTRMIPMIPMGDPSEGAWVDLGVGPMVITAVKGDCVFGTGDVAPDYSSEGGLPIPAASPLFFYTDISVWARLAPGIVEGEIIVGPL
jgi:hypothetical protein